jgi:hypothetical protein
VKVAVAPGTNLAVIDSLIFLEISERMYPWKFYVRTHTDYRASLSKAGGARRESRVAHAMQVRQYLLDHVLLIR